MWCRVAPCLQGGLDEVLLRSWNAVRDDIALQLGHHIRVLRKKHGFTQEELARRSKVSIKYLQALEGKDPYNATVITLKKLSDGFDIPLWKLLKFEDQ